MTSSNLHSLEQVNKIKHCGFTVTMASGVTDEGRWGELPIPAS